MSITVQEPQESSGKYLLENEVGETVELDFEAILASHDFSSLSQLAAFQELKSAFEKGFFFWYRHIEELHNFFVLEYDENENWQDLSCIRDFLVVNYNYYTDTDYDCGDDDWEMIAPEEEDQLRMQKEEDRERQKQDYIEEGDENGYCPH